MRLVVYRPVDIISEIEAFLVAKCANYRNRSLFFP